MRLGDDRRGRVPFALVGVVLLVASTAFAAAIQTRDPTTVDSDASLALEAATTTARTALVAAGTRAARDAARRPLQVPANTTYGRVVNRSTPFRDALRVRIYVAARDALGRLEPTVGDVTATVSLPPVSDASSLRAAKRRVTLVRANATRLLVQVDGLAVRAHRTGRVVASESYAATVSVPTPVVGLHRNVTDFERRLNMAPTEGGLGAAVTGRLWAMAWARGYAQYGDAPIANVLGNRHVALATNAAAVDLQRATFGRADPDTGTRLRAATARTGLADLLGGLREGTGETGASTPGSPPVGPSPARVARSPAGRPLRVGVNRSAGEALLAYIDGAATPSLAATLDRVYSLDARPRTAVRTLSVTASGERVPDGARVTDTSQSTDVRVTTASAGDVSTPDGFRRLETTGRRVVERVRTTRQWRDSTTNETGTATTVQRTASRVTVAVVARPGRPRHAPQRSLRARPGHSGPFGGRAPAAAETAVDRVLGHYGGADVVARRAATGAFEPVHVRVPIERDADVTERVRSDLLRLDRRTANVSVTMPPSEVMAANPPERLAESLRERRDDLVGAPRAYDTFERKALVAARGAYLAAVRRQLSERASGENALRDRLGAVLSDRGASQPAPPNRTVQGMTASAVNATPAYLSVTRVSASRPGVRRGYYPLAARNVNVFTVPYDDAADGVVSAVLDRSSSRVSLRTAGRALREANRTLRHVDNRTLERRRERLRKAVAAGVERVRRRSSSTLASDGALSGSERDDAVEEAFDQWGTVHARALATANGSLARALAAHVPSTGRATRRVRVRLAVSRALRDVTVAQAPTAKAGRTTKRVARRVLTKAVGNGVSAVSSAAADRWLSGPLTAIPSGLPLTPVPGYWYATMNAWHVDVRGRYAQFAVSAPAERPGRPPVTYRRRAERVTLDVDGDGTRERLGRNRPVSFAVSTAVVVVVPPGGNGVGDTDGNMVEESPGWSTD